MEKGVEECKNVFVAANLKKYATVSHSSVDFHANKECMEE